MKMKTFLCASRCGSKVTLYVFLHSGISILQHGAQSYFEVSSVKFEEHLIVTHKHGFGGGDGCWCFTTANILDSRHCRLCSVVKSRRTFEVSLNLSGNFLNLLAYSKHCLFTVISFDITG